MTVHFVDAEHLLVTFATRSLVPRLPDAQPDDQDEIVAAELIQLPTGKLLASTRWHLHDHMRYLWNLGDGRFLFRSRDLLSTFAPMANLPAGHPFERTAFTHRRGMVMDVNLSPDNRLLTVETAMPVPKPFKAANATKMPTGGATAATAAVPATVPIIVLGDGPAKPDIRLDVYRLAGRGSEKDPLLAGLVQSLRSDGVVQVPVDSDGYLDAEEKPRNHWSVKFYEFGGQTHPLAPIDSGCPPDMQMVSRSQYVSLACRGVQGGKTLLAFDLEKHAIWEEPLGMLAAAPFFAYAPNAGRFAMSGRLESSSGPSDDGTVTVTPTEDLRVYQTQTGDLLLKVSCDPVFQTAENFDLTADGMRAAVVRGGAIEVYRLPELTKLDKQDLADLQKVTPPENASARVDLRKLLIEEEQEAKEAAAQTKAVGEASLPATNASSAKTSAAATFSEAAPATVQPKVVERPSVSGDVQEDGPRKPPTLLLPGEKADIRAKDDKPR